VPERDELVERGTRELSALPPVREEAIERILELAAQRRAAERGLQDPPAADRPRRGAWRLRPRWWIGIAFAAALASVLWVGAARDADGPAAPAADAPSTAAVDAGATAGAASTFAVADLAAADEAPRAVQFVLDAPGARSVSLVGRFNDWDPVATRLERVAGSAVWTATVSLAPGRYEYAFVVDDSTWVLDPRAPRSQDPDYGVESSVLLVGRE